MQGWDAREQEVAGPQNALSGIVAKTAREAELHRCAYTRLLFEPFSSLGIIWTAPWRFDLSMCSQDKHTAQWHRKVGEPGFWFPCCGKEIKKLGTIAAAKIKNKKMGKWKAWDKWMRDLILISGAEKRQKKGEISTVGFVKSPTWILV